MPDYSARLRRVQGLMAEQAIDVLFLPPSASLHYLTGIAREQPNFGNTMYPGEWLHGAWIRPDGAPLITLPRMSATFHSVPSGNLRVLPEEGVDTELAQAIIAELGGAHVQRVAIEDRTRAETLLALQDLLPQAEFCCSSRLLLPLRQIKDAEEIGILREAGAITERAYAATIARLKHGMSTLDLISEVDYQLRLHGALSGSFVTACYNMGPHFPFDFQNREETLRLPLEPPVAVSFDFGAAYEGYCYDFGRSVFFGEPDKAYREAYDLVIAAQAAGIDALRSGGSCAQADAIARAVINDGGYGHAFMHRLGHGIGMDVHEPPFLTHGDQTGLQPGMCFTVEPSIFLPHRFGARVEDVVVVGDQGGEALTSGFRELLVVS